MANAQSIIPDALLWPGIPLWGMFLVVLVTAIRHSPRWLESWLQRQRDRQAAKDSDSRRWLEEIEYLRNELKTERRERQKESEHCRAELADVREELAAERAERMKLRSIIDGIGEIRKAGAHAAAEERERLRQKGGSDG